jgi:flagellar motor switch protein FliM
MENNLTRDKIQQLLNAVGQRADKDTSQNINATDYNWRQSKYFTREQLKKIESFAQKAANNVAANFKTLYQCNFEITASVSQHTAGEFTKADDANKQYYLAFGAKDQKVGYLAMPAQTAILWATQLLGDTKSEISTDKEMSQLELSLLLDIASTAIKGFSESYSSELSANGEIGKKIPLELDSIQDVCKITIDVKKTGSEQASQASFIIMAEKLSAIAGQVKTENISPQNVQKALLTYIQNIPVSFTVKFADINLNLQDLMSLQANDTIVLNKKVNEAVDVIFNDRVIYRAKPAKANDNYAVVISELYSKK